MGVDVLQIWVEPESLRDDGLGGRGYIDEEQSLSKVFVNVLRSPDNFTNF